MDCPEHKNDELAHCPSCLADYWRMQYESAVAKQGELVAQAGEVMRGRCADSIGCVSPQVLLNYVHQASNAIRALPGVTLADLK